MAEDPLVGKKIGQYEVESLLGYGGMAAVYVAYQPSMKRHVAIKVLADLLTKEPNFIARFDREVELVANLEHVHIVPVYEHGTTEDGLTYLTMRYVKGGTLTERIKQGPMALDTVSKILDQVAEALDYAHQSGIIHRDIKPSNVLLDKQGNAYLADFGLAQTIDPAQRKNLTQTGTLVGTPAYISPEQALEARSEARSDLYSLGVVVYEMVTGKPPFSGDSMFAVMQSHIAEPPPPALKYRPDLPGAVDLVLQKALAKKPDERYQTATDFAREFARAIKGQLLAARRASAPTVTMLPTLTSILRNQPKNVRLFGVGLLLVLFVVLSMLIAAPYLDRSAPTPTYAPLTLADESLRPAVGTPDQIAPTTAEVQVARNRLQGSFIGIMACTLETEFHASLVRAARTRASAYGLAVQVEDSKTDQFRQTAIINQFIAQGAKVIVMCPLNEDTVTPAVAAAQDAGLVVVSIGDKVFGKASVTLTLTNETMGRQVGLFASDLINKELGGNANIIILGYPQIPGVVIRADTMEKTVRELAPKAQFLPSTRTSTSS
jgi:serine/threonine protein kinase